MRIILAYSLVILLLCTPLVLANVYETREEHAAHCSMLVNDEWNRRFGGSYYDGAEDMIQTRDENFLIAGYIHGFNQPMSDGWLINMDGEGNELWNKTYGGGNEDILFSVIEAEDGFV
ncbi:MAG: hypothetical protein ACP5FL_07395, partial [Thermoplasmatota archaeon]